jgi:hypothetical protein
VDWVYIVPHGAKIEGKPIFIADKVSPPLRLEWSGSGFTIKAPVARVFRSVSQTTVGAQTISIVAQIATIES